MILGLMFNLFHYNYSYRLSVGKTKEANHTIRGNNLQLSDLNKGDEM